jgi:hypothetical protein
MLKNTTFILNQTKPKFNYEKITLLFLLLNVSFLFAQKKFLVS